MFNETSTLSEPIKVKKPSLPPILEQYFNIKKTHPEALLFFRVGDFYELFDDDAVIAAKELDIQLTKKSSKFFSVPMAGVPAHSYESYLAKLVKAGYKVAICEQVETPEEAKKAKRNLVSREVVRIVTAGTATEDSIVSSDSFNFLASIVFNKKEATIAWLDLSTGDFYVETSSEQEFCNILHRIAPKEIIVSTSSINKLPLNFKDLLTPFDDARFNFLSNSKALQTAFVAPQILGFTAAQAVACGVILQYVELTQKGNLKLLAPPKLWLEHNKVRLDSFTLKSLELESSLANTTKGSLKEVVNQAKTRPGSRLIHEWLVAPLTDVKLINERLDAVEFFYQNKELTDEIREQLSSMPDMIRLCSKLMFNRGGPRDLYNLKLGLEVFTKIRASLLAYSDVPALMSSALLKCTDFSPLHFEIHNTLRDIDYLPLNAKAGGFVQLGYKADFSALKEEETNLKKAMLELQLRYISQTGISGLKLQYNNVIGYFLEVSNKHANVLLVRYKDNFILKQTLANVSRFTTTEMIQNESALNKVALQINSFEEELFKSLVELTVSYKDCMLALNYATAVVDVISSFAVLAHTNNYVKPKVTEGTTINIVAGRHPVVEQSLLRNNEERFVDNDCSLAGASTIHLITGPNMAGKSTFLRQNALIIIMAQMGSFVSAKKAEIGVVDAIFSRVGAGDNLYKGQSTFMVEMLETSTILNNATSRSFIILDEIGRGTSTYDGIAIAHAAVKFLHYKKAKVLFATHYHELTELSDSLDMVKNYHMCVSEHEDKIIFLHKIAPGRASGSYGIYVAEISGMPKVVIDEAYSYLNFVINSHKNSSISTKIHSAYSANPSVDGLISSCNDPEPNVKAVIEQIRQVDLDDISPKEAWALLAKLKGKL